MRTPNVAFDVPLPAIVLAAAGAGAFGGLAPVFIALAAKNAPSVHPRRLLEFFMTGSCPRQGLAFAPASIARHLDVRARGLPV